MQSVLVLHWSFVNHRLLLTSEMCIWPDQNSLVHWGELCSCKQFWFKHILTFVCVEIFTKVRLCCESPSLLYVRDVHMAWPAFAGSVHWAILVSQARHCLGLGCFSLIGVSQCPNAWINLPLVHPVKDSHNIMFQTFFSQNPNTRRKSSGCSWSLENHSSSHTWGK